MSSPPAGVANSKPLDLGNGEVCVSFDPATAAWLSLGRPHPGVGFVELSGLPPFDEACRGDADATRRHRRDMTRGDHAFLVLEIDGGRPLLRPNSSNPGAPRWMRHGITVEARLGKDATTLEQAWSIRRPADFPASTVLRLRGRIDRPALAEITETDPPRPTGAETRFDLRGSTAFVDCATLATRADVTVRGAAVAWRRDRDGLIGDISWPAGESRGSFTVSVSLSVDNASRRPAPVGSMAYGDELVDRSLAYIRGCTALRVGDEERAIVTDHRILPLSWTRDAYWQAFALLAADGAGDRSRVADHLRWLWRRCDRPDGRWVRSHHTDGRRKDLPFQADQQLYPLLELADYWRFGGSVPDGVAWEVEVPRAWAAAVAEIDPAFGLIRSDENAADDPAPAPCIAASQILLWYSAERLRELARNGLIGLGEEELAATSARVRNAFGPHFIKGSDPWPYAVDPSGSRVAYHDANDLPTALAPLWGFCRPDDPGWGATMAFAFSPQNPAWADGPVKGLGSAHTAGAWTLGDVQAWIWARACGDAAASERSLRRLRAMAFPDSMLPEAIGHGGEPVRHWFAWPGAAIAALLMLDGTERLEQVLGVAGAPRA